MARPLGRIQVEQIYDVNGVPFGPPASPIPGGLLFTEYVYSGGAIATLSIPGLDVNTWLGAHILLNGRLTADGGVSLYINNDQTANKYFKRGWINTGAHAGFNANDAILTNTTAGGAGFLIEVLLPRNVSNSYPAILFKSGGVNSGGGAYWGAGGAMMYNGSPSNITQIDFVAAGTTFSGTFSSRISVFKNYGG